ncbi:MAG: hypothetical protein K2W95_03060 [Candidatus Obscuribacterales bacterium]|nr:hypothetical protein [Candidatus Obscuribacterales bacterium]
MRIDLRARGVPITHLPQGKSSGVSMSSAYPFHGLPEGFPGAIPVPGDVPAPPLRSRIIAKTGVPEIEWVAMYIPVVAVVEDIDEQVQTEGGLSYRIVGRRALAQKLHVNESQNIAMQLFQARILTEDEALFLDSDFFREAQSWRVHFKIEAKSVPIPVYIASLTATTSTPCQLLASIPTYINHLETTGLIERWWGVQQTDSGYMVNVGTARLTELLRTLSTANATLHSLNSAMLYS